MIKTEQTISGKIIPGVLTACIVGVLGVIYKTDRNNLALMHRIDKSNTQIALDIAYMKKNFDRRLDRIENSIFTTRDAEQLKTWTELKIEALNVQVQSNKASIVTLTKHLN